MKDVTARVATKVRHAHGLRPSGRGAGITPRASIAQSQRTVPPAPTVSVASTPIEPVAVSPSASVLDPSVVGTSPAPA